MDGGPLSVPDETTAQLLWRTAEQSATDSGGYRFPEGDGTEFKAWSWPEVKRRVSFIAAGLLEQGVQRGDRVALVCETRPEWKLVDQAVHAVGAVLVPVYPTLPADQVQYIIKDSGATLVIVEDAAQAEKVEGPLWSIDPVPPHPDLEALSAIGEERLSGDPTCIDDAVAAGRSDEVACIVYTSGTTGVPKGVVLTHRHWTASTHANVDGLGLRDIEDPSILAFLPLAHVAGYAAALALTEIRGTIAFSRPDRMAADFPRIRPTLLIAVPRLYERIMQKIRAAVAESSSLRQALFARAETVAMDMGRALEDGGTPSAALRLRHWLYERLVYSKLRKKLGFDRAKVGLTGAAAVRPDLLYFLQGMGLNIVEAYGMTETTGLVTTNLFHRFKAGTVGRPMAGTKVRLADDGEILITGPMVFQGYWNNPEETKASLVEADGETWLRSGDIGTVDGDGFIAIVDRKKELEVLDTGKMIAPVRVEEMLKSVTPLVEDSCLVGTGRKFAVLLIQPAYDALLDWMRRENIEVDESEIIRMKDPTGEVRTYGLPDRLLRLPKVRAAFDDAIGRLNQRLADFERVRIFDLVPHAFTVDRGELTPTFKKKRRVILDNHGDRVEAMFQGPAPS